MSYRLKTIAAAALSLAAIAPMSFASAADLPVKVKAKPVADVPFFFVNDNLITYAVQFTATSPGVTDKTVKQVYAYTHFDLWAYGTNFITLSLAKSDHADPANPCGDPFTATPVFGCAGAAEFYGLIRSTLGWNQLFNTKQFSIGPLANISFEVGVDGETENQFLAPNKKDVVAGLQFAFDLPYKGFFDVAPLYYQEWNHNAFLQSGTFLPAPYPGISDGNTRFDATWALELNYYMELGFLPQAIQYFAISGRAGFYGPKGLGASSGIISPVNNTKMEINSEPIRLTFDASKAFYPGGAKYSHFLDFWVAYRYWENKFGLNDQDPTNGVCYTAGVNNRSCTEKSLYAGVTAKF
ncbi:hypothetical protein [Bradyrhizobium sp.]|jgi:hypothetical protein|uniref:hypothetical protein n=1 Tax=Bradyrhizobium sp. TaxID=376 RepID=UPI003C1C134C